LIVCVVIFAVLIRRSFAERRAEKIQKFANEIGYSFSQNEEKIIPILKSLPLYSQGSSRTVSNIISKQSDELEISMFDYEHETYTPGKHYDPRKHVRSIQTVVMFNPENIDLPPLEIHPGERHPSISPELVNYVKKHPMIEVESNGSTLLVYEGEILHSADDLDYVLKEAVRVYEIIKRTPNNRPTATND